MYSPRKHLETPKYFRFPYEPPYAIQQHLMEQLYNVLEHKKIGIFESPTGTGKSLTLTCAALRWLEDHNQLVRADLQRRIDETENQIKRLEAENAYSADWITSQFLTKQQRDELYDLRTLENLLKKHEERLSDLKERKMELNVRRNETHKRSKQSDSNEVEDSEFALELNEVGETSELQAEADAKSASEEMYREVQIFFCSRTHSQLAQVLREVKRTEYGKYVRCVSMASRQQLCINPTVKGLPSVGLINERCLDLAKGKTAQKNSCKCTFKNPDFLQDLCDTMLTDILDIEDLVESAEELKACPYYATRAAVSSSMAQLVMLPYQMLLHRRTRQQSGIDLRGAVVIIDEAHNLLDTISQLHSCELTMKQLQAAQEQIVGYKMRYAKRFSAANLLQLNQLLFVVKRLTKLLQSSSLSKEGQKAVVASTPRILPAYQVAAEGDFFNIDLLQLIRFCENNRLAQKLQGFARYSAENPLKLTERENEAEGGTKATKQLLQRLEEEAKLRQQPKAKRKVLQESNSQTHEDTQSNEEKNKLFTLKPSPMHPLLAFLQALTEKAEDGRVFIHAGHQDASYKYMVLNPADHFRDVLTEARAVIIAGGTMQPTNELTEQLFASCPNRIETHFYDHVVPAANVSSFIVQRGPKGGQLCYNFSQRASKEMLSELLMMLQNLCQVVPAGLVCFFPSYDYLDLVYKELQNSPSILHNIESRKQIFREPRSSSNGAGEGKGRSACSQSVEQMLESYATSIRLGRSHGRGALLLSVVGGKLSEGLNFADDLGRGVVVVGLPYANSQSAELQERMRYLDATLSPGAGNEYYENLCLKAVNQCIGRSVRHIRDYACVFLLDERYAKEHIRNKLPKWISRSLTTPASFGLVQAMTAKFFRDKRTN